VTPAEPGWEIQAEELSASGLLHAPERTRQDRDEQRRHLRLVQEQARRCANGRRLLISVGIALLGVFCLGLVTLHVLTAENQFTLDRLQQSAATEQASYEKLRLQIADLEAPARIVSQAEGRLGLVQPGSVTYLPAISSQGSKGGGTDGDHAKTADPSKDTRSADDPVLSGSVAAPQGDADWPSIKPYLSGSP
jgi:cell division protein FtsL